MKDEIKEILDNIKNKYEDYYVQDIVSGNDLKQLLDYITNLQEENENLKDFNNKLQATKDRLDKYDKENTMLIEDYKSRIEKAIDYIKENCIKSDKWEDLGFCNFVPTGKISYNSLSVKKVKELLNILQGVDNNDN